MTDTSWYYLLLGEEMGPVSLETLRELVREQQLSEFDEVRRTDSSATQRIADVAELQNRDMVATVDDLDAMLASGDVADSFDLDSMMAIDLAATDSPAPRKVNRWFYKVFNQEVGPFEFDMLRSLAEAGELGPDDQVRDESEFEWNLAQDIEGLFAGIRQSATTASGNIGGNLSSQRTAVAPSRWFCRILNQEMGPYDMAALRAMAESGELQPTDSIRREKGNDWESASSISTLFAGIKQDAVTASSATGILSPQRAAIPRKSEPVIPAIPAEAPSAPQPAAASAPAAPAAVTSPAPAVSSASTYSPPPISRPSPQAPAPTRPAPPRPTPAAFSAKSKSTGGSGGPAISIDPKILGGIAGVLLLGVAIYFLPGLLKVDRTDYDQTAGMCQQVVTMYAEGGDKANWQELGAKLKSQIMGHESKLKSKPDSELNKLLLKIYAESIPKIVDGSPDERTAGLKSMQDYLEAAKKIVE